LKSSSSANAEDCIINPVFNGLYGFVSWFWFQFDSIYSVLSKKSACFNFFSGNKCSSGAIV
jgi:hypothetical protein